MVRSLVEEDVLFEIKDVLGRKIRTTKSYWLQIKEIKHPELRYGIREVKRALKSPDEVRKSPADPTILLYAKKVATRGILVVAVKALNGEGFLVTVYQTNNYKKKGELVWQKPEEI